MTGENFDDSQQRTGGGRNGVGVKIAGILSHEFEVQCVNLGQNQIFYKCTDPHAKLLSVKYEGTDAESIFASGGVKRGPLTFARLGPDGGCTTDTLIRVKEAVYRNVGPLHYTQRFTNNLESEPPTLCKPTVRLPKNPQRESPGGSICNDWHVRSAVRGCWCAADAGRDIAACTGDFGRLRRRLKIPSSQSKTTRRHLAATYRALFFNADEVPHGGVPDARRRRESGVHGWVCHRDSVQLGKAH